MNSELLRKLPKVDEFLKLPIVQEEVGKSNRTMIVNAIRETIDFYRKQILVGRLENYSQEELIKTFKKKLVKQTTPRLRKVINCTGIIIHTNLGRSILSKEAIQNVIIAAENYSNLEYDLEKGSRGSRYSLVEELIKKVTGAEAAMVVNNNAAAVMLVLDTLCKGREAIVSRGQLVEIGGSFRVPEVMAFSGAKLVEVGTTNRTHLYDYEGHINENTGVLLKVHTSNFKIFGFTEEVSLEELVKLGNSKGIPVVEDIGSGVLIDFSKFGLMYEPTVQQSIKKGVDVVTFSGDKMLGGPQAGIIAGKKNYIDRIKKNQLTRALRIDKMTLAALEGTLKVYDNEDQAVEKIPTLYMILSSKEVHKKRAQRLRRKLQSLNSELEFNIKEDFSMVGGGSMPTEKIETYVITVKSLRYSTHYIESYLRNYSIPIITRINNGEILMDLRTILDDDISIIGEAFKNMREDGK
jgi:L-seryl-tRNA(Ser) seleniumtransferase